MAHSEGYRAVTLMVFSDPEIDVHFYEVSGEDGENLEELFQHCANQIKSSKVKPMPLGN